MTWQLVVRPGVVASAKKLAEKIMTNDALLPSIGKKGLHLGPVFYHINNLLFGVADTVGSAYSGSSREMYGARQKPGNEGPSQRAPVRDPLCA